MTWGMKEQLVGSVALLELNGRLTMGGATEALETELRSVIVRGHPNLLLDCSQVNGIDSGGIGTLVRYRATAQKHGGSLKLLNPSARLRAALELVGLFKVIESFDDKTSALASFN
jgi:anti-sigma B factor antagonist